MGGWGWAIFIFVLTLPNWPLFVSLARHYRHLRYETPQELEGQWEGFL